MSDYYSNGRPKWDDQFRETEWERRERQKAQRQKLAARLANRTPPTREDFQDAGAPMLDEETP